MTSDDDDRSSLGQLNDPNIKIIPGKAFHSEEEFGLEQSWKDKTALSIEDIKKIRKLLDDNYNLTKKEGKDSKKLYLNELLSGSKIILPSLEIPKRDPVLEKRITQLKRKLEEKEYKRMTSNVNNYSSQHQALPEDSIGFQMKQMNSVIIAVIQFVISLAAAFLFGFHGIELFVGPLDLAVRLLLGIAAAVIVGGAELYIMVVHLDAREGNQDTIHDKKVK